VRYWFSENFVWNSILGHNYPNFSRLGGWRRGCLFLFHYYSPCLTNPQARWRSRVEFPPLFSVQPFLGFIYGIPISNLTALAWEEGNHLIRFTFSSFPHYQFSYRRLCFYMALMGASTHSSTSARAAQFLIKEMWTVQASSSAVRNHQHAEF